MTMKPKSSNTFVRINGSDFLQPPIQLVQFTLLHILNQSMKRHSPCAQPCQLPIKSLQISLRWTIYISLQTNQLKNWPTLDSPTGVERLLFFNLLTSRSASSPASQSALYLLGHSQLPTKSVPSKLLE